MIEKKTYEFTPKDVADFVRSQMHEYMLYDNHCCSEVLLSVAKHVEEDPNALVRFCMNRDEQKDPDKKVISQSLVCDALVTTFWNFENSGHTQEEFRDELLINLGFENA